MPESTCGTCGPSTRFFRPWRWSDSAVQGIASSVLGVRKPYPVRTVRSTERSPVLDSSAVCKNSMKASERASTRREPKQQRSRQTVDAVLEAVQRVLRRHGAEAITTNRVAEAAGVSIGSLYQYFPEKQAIFMALHDRHVDRVRHVIEGTMTDCTSVSLEEFTRELVERLANVHSEDAELHELVSATVPGGANGFKSALRAVFEQVISPAKQDRYTPEDTKRMLFVLPHMVEALVHGVAHQKQASSRERAKDEAIRTVAVYLNSFQGGHPARY
jgi:AcrR family transcriptional regulator